MLFPDTFSVSMIVLDRWSLKITHIEREKWAGVWRCRQTSVQSLISFFFLFFFYLRSKSVMTQTAPRAIHHIRVKGDQWSSMDANSISPAAGRHDNQTHLGPPCAPEILIPFQDFTKFRPNPVYPSEGEIPVLYIPGLNLTSLSPRSLPRACRREGDKTGNFLPGSSCFSNPPPAEGETAVIMFHQRRGLTPLSWSRFLYLNPPVGQTCASVRRKRRHVRVTDAPEWRWRS